MDMDRDYYRGLLQQLAKHRPCSFVQPRLSAEGAIVVDDECDEGIMVLEDDESIERVLDAIKGIPA